MGDMLQKVDFEAATTKPASGEIDIFTLKAGVFNIVVLLLTTCHDYKIYDAGVNLNDYKSSDT
eukprot:3449806-Heterocapsa_arctica.AAC.1